MISPRFILKSSKWFKRRIVNVGSLLVGVLHLLLGRKQALCQCFADHSIRRVDLGRCSFYLIGLYLTSLFNWPFLTGPMEKIETNWNHFNQPYIWTKIFPVGIKFIFKIIKFGDEIF